jgi:arsenical pump membrane protein
MISPFVVLLIFLSGISLTMLLVLKKSYIPITIQKKQFHIETYFMGVMLCASMLIIFGILNYDEVMSALRGTEQVSPFGILVLFMSMVFMSIFLDECGFFEYCAKRSIQNAHHDGKRLFISLYFVVSILTIFTSNDIIIITFTPFIYYFAKHAKINPMPYLFAEFFAANTWSIMFYISNPTNIVISSAFDIRFLEYFRWMFFPALAAGFSNFFVIYKLFKKDICHKIEKNEDINPSAAINDMPGTIFGLITLASCIILLFVAPYIDVEMSYIALGFAMILFLFIILRYTFHKIKRKGRHPVHSILESTLGRMPWSIVLFILSLFILVKSLEIYGIIGFLSTFFERISFDNAFLHSIVFGVSSTISANILNNIPMTIAFVPILTGIAAGGRNLLASSLAVIIGSNLGANLTPLGSLAGIMWIQILKHKKYHISFWEFIKFGSIVTLVTLSASLIVLGIEFLIF